MEFNQQMMAEIEESIRQMAEKPCLTRREQFANENHAQMIRFVQRGQISSDDAAKLSVVHADALIAELDKGE
jgi:hypothetical protein